MDCNNYSYAPSMLSGERQQIAYYENDDMYMELDRDCDVYCVTAMSWDGSLDVAEEFSLLSKAAALYEFLEAYQDTPPGDELDSFIHERIYDGRYV